MRQLAASLVETHGVELGRRHDLAHLDLEGVEVSGKELVALGNLSRCQRTSIQKSLVFCVPILEH